MIPRRLVRLLLMRGAFREFYYDLVGHDRPSVASQGLAGYGRVYGLQYGGL